MKIFKFVGGCFATALVSFLLGYVGASLYCTPPVTSADYAAWVGAIGTVGTLIGTIWLATISERRRSREETARAGIAAHAIHLRITSSWGIVRKAKETLESDAIRAFQYAKVADAIDSAPRWSDEEVLPLIVLPCNVAAELVATRDVLRHCVDLLRSGNPRGLTDPPNSPQIEQEVIRHLGQADQSLGKIARECQKYLRRTMRVEL